MRELRSLTGIRAVAALWVLFFHSSFADLPHMPGPAATVLRAGYAAVSLFFVLSGFILTYNYLPREGSPAPHQRLGHYFVARMARIYPVYLLAMGFSALIKLPPIATAPYAGMPSFTENVVTLFGLQSWTIGSGIWLNFPSWSVSCEVFFYALLPLLIVLVRRVPERHAWSFFVVAALLTTAFAGLESAIVVRHPETAQYFQFMPLFRTMEFVTGSALGYAFVCGKLPAVLTRRPDLTVAGAALGAVAFILAFSNRHVFLHSGGLAIPFALALLGLSQSKGFFHRALSTKAAVVLGEMSFSLYILQVPLKEFTNDVWQHLHGDAARTVGIRAFTFVLVLVVTYLVSRFVENPARRWILALHRRRTEARRASA